jgi:hypothetical protein
VSAASLSLRGGPRRLLRSVGGGWGGDALPMRARLDQLRHRLWQIGPQEDRPSHGQPVHADLHARIHAAGDAPPREQPTRERPQGCGHEPSSPWPALRNRTGRGLSRSRQSARRSLRFLPGRPRAGGRFVRRPARPASRWGRLRVHHCRRHLAIGPTVVRGRHFASLAQFHDTGYLENSQLTGPGLRWTARNFLRGRCYYSGHVRQAKLA